MSFIDFHCDTLEWFGVTATPEGDLYRNKRAVDFCRMRSVDQKGQFFAMYMPVPGPSKWVQNPAAKKDGVIWDEGWIRTLYGAFRRSVEAHPDIVAHTSSWAEYEAARAAGKMAAFLTMEDGRVVNGKMENLRAVREGGVSLITLTWNQRNCFGSPTSSDPEKMAEGLTDFGREAVPYMNELGILVDVSHLSDGGFYDVAALSTKPFVASHSNARALSPHPRNLTDEMIRILADKGGIMGLNYCPQFLQADAKGTDSTVADMVRHLTYIKKVGGVGVMALGSDLDGINGNLEINSVDRTPILFDALKKAGFTSGEIDKLAFENAERVFRECL